MEKNFNSNRNYKLKKISILIIIIYKGYKFYFIFFLFFIKKNEKSLNFSF